MDLVEGGAADPAATDVPRFSTNTTRHLCLTDLARMGWELHAIATFAGHRSTESTRSNISSVGRDLSAKLNGSMATIHAQRVEMLTTAAADAERQERSYPPSAADGWSAACVAEAVEESAGDGAWHKVGAISATTTYGA